MAKSYGSGYFEKRTHANSPSLLLVQFHYLVAAQPSGKRTSVAVHSRLSHYRSGQLESHVSQKTVMSLQVGEGIAVPLLPEAPTSGVI